MPLFFKTTVVQWLCNGCAIWLCNEGRGRSTTLWACNQKFTFDKIRPLRSPKRLCNLVVEFGCGIWLCNLAVQFGCAIWLCNLAVQFGCAIWLCNLAVQFIVVITWFRARFRVNCTSKIFKC